MNQADYDAFLADPLHREFVQEHERRTTKPMTEDERINLLQLTLRSVERYQASTRETLEHTEITLTTLSEKVREYLEFAPVISQKTQWILDGTERLGWLMLVIALVLIAGFGAVVASLQGWL